MKILKTQNHLKTQSFRTGPIKSFSVKRNFAREQSYPLAFLRLSSFYSWFYHKFVIRPHQDNFDNQAAPSTLEVLSNEALTNDERTTN